MFLPDLIIYFSIIIAGFIFEILFFYVLRILLKEPLRKNHKFHLFRDLSFFSIPIWGLLALIMRENFDLVQIFIVSAIIGTLSEHTIGYLLHKIDGHKLWEYRYGRWFGGYTSWFVIPYWGGAGLIFYTIILFLAK